MKVRLDWDNFQFEWAFNDGLLTTYIHLTIVFYNSHIDHLHVLAPAQTNPNQEGCVVGLAQPTTSYEELQDVDMPFLCLVCPITSKLTFKCDQVAYETLSKAVSKSSQTAA